MIPTWNVDPDAAIPTEASYWMPGLTALQSENGGIGYFHDTWIITDVSLEEASGVVGDEFHAIKALDGAATDEEAFERLAAFLDFYNCDFPPDDEDGDDAAAMALLARYGDVETIDLGRLEVGVAGLSHALAAVGCVPVASCRAHSGGRPSWADRPLVVAAIDRAHAEWLHPLVRRARCGFALDLNRPAFLTIDAASIRELNDLASAVLDEAERNPPPPLVLGIDEDED